MGQMKPQPAILTCWRILLALIMVVPAFLTALFFRVPSGAWAGLSAAWIVLFLVFYVVYLPLRYRNLSFSLNGQKVLLYSGVIYRRVRVIPLRNVQFTAIYRNPLERIFGLCSLTVSSAGGRATLPGLRMEDAQALSQSLLEVKP